MVQSIHPASIFVIIGLRNTWWQAFLKSMQISQMEHFLGKIYYQIHFPRIKSAHPLKISTSYSSLNQFHKSAHPFTIDFFQLQRPWADLREITVHIYQLCF